MVAGMSAMFPKGIKVLMVDDDARFVRKAITLMSALKFDVTSCGSATFALNSLVAARYKDIDVVLAHAAKAAACGFDFRAIVESDLGIPVVYFLPLDHEATGDEADALLSTLEAGTYIMKKPLDLDEVRGSLWTVVAWRKCYLEAKAAGGAGPVVVGGNNRTVAAAAASEGAGGGEDNEDRVYYKVVRKGRGRKRKDSSKTGGSSSRAAAAADDEDLPPAKGKGKGKEKDNVASEEEPAPARQKPEQDNPKHFRFEQSGQRQPRPSLFGESLLRTLNVPPYNPNFFSDGAGPSSNPAAAGSAAFPAPPRPVYLATAPAPAPLRSVCLSTAPALAPPPRPVYSSAPPALPPAAAAAHHPVFGSFAPPAARQQQLHPAAHNAVFGSIAPPAARQQQLPAPQLHPAAHNAVFGTVAPPAARQHQHPAAHNPVFGSVAPPVAHNFVFGTIAPPAAIQQQQQPAAHNVVFGNIETPAASQQQQRPAAHNVVFGNIEPPASATPMAAAAATAAYEPQFSNGTGNQQPQDVPPMLMFGAFPYQGPSPAPVVQQDMTAPTVAGDLFAGGTAGGGGANVGASAAAAAATGADAYGNNEASSFPQPQYLVGEEEDDEEVIAADMVKMYTSMPDPPMAPQHVGDNPSDKMVESLFSDNFDDNPSSLVAPDGQALDVSRFVNELIEVAGGGHGTGSTDAASAASFMAPQDLGAVPDAGSSNYASFMAPQDAGAAPYGRSDYTAPVMAPQDLGAVPNGGSTNAAAFMAPQQDLGAAPNNGGEQLAPDNNVVYESPMGSQVQDTTAAKFASDQYEDNTMFPLEALLEDGRFPWFNDFSMDLDAQLGDSGSTGGGGDAAGSSSLTGGEGGGGGNMDDNFGISDLDGLEIPDELFPEFDDNPSE